MAAAQRSSRAGHDVGEKGFLAMAYDPTAPSMSAADFPSAFATIRENFRTIVAGDSGVFTLAGAFDFQITTTGTSSSSRFTARAGSGTTSSRNAYVRVESLETSPQAWHLGMLGDKNFGIRDNTAASTVVIVDTSGRVAVGGVAPSANALEVYGSTSLFTYRSTLALYDPTALAASNGAGIALGGKYTAAGAYTPWAAIQAVKDNATDGNYAGGLAVFTRSAGVAAAQRFFFDSKANVVMGVAALATNATDGFFYLDACAGTPTGSPTSYAGRIPFVFDSTNHKLYAFSGGVWKSTAAFT
jgi:hypothetical protein